MGQDEHFDIPVTFVKEPMLQFAHDPPATALYVPAEQGAQEVDPYEDDDPIGQGVHTLLFG